ncbi:hypothetical protein M9Y10_020843 [Tritrichomonas musculus]|uniref:Serine/threonine-protein phosphatase n=1 Tax=Tritrichomonas musculus TaxID=1915356 RepID=A0ABR2HEQ0_9EUKA
MEDSIIRQTIFTILTSRMYKGNHKTSFPSKNILSIIKKAKEIFIKESSLLQLHDEFTIVGDIHGNIDDLLRIFEKCEYPPKTNYVFLGDYVDRGQNSLEVIILLFCLKILYPKSLFLLRGNHECESITTIYGFKNECERFYDANVYNKFMKCFMHLPYAAVVNNSYLCLHGGISPFLKTLDDIDQIEKPQVTTDSQIASDIVWSDPNESSKGFQNSPRGCGYYFNDKKLNFFLNENRLTKLIRSHESCFDGYDYPLENCITIFSNTDYCKMSNDAAVIHIKNEPEVELHSENSDSEQDELDIFKYEDDPHLLIEVFSPLNDEQLNKRRVLIPESLLVEMAPKELPINDCSLSHHSLLDQISDQPICVY